MNVSVLCRAIACLMAILILNYDALAGAGACNLSLSSSGSNRTWAGETISLTVANGTAPYTWTTSNSSVASISASGASCTVTAVAPGTATITVSDSRIFRGELSPCTRTYTVRVVGVEKLQWNDDGTWTDVPSTLYVMKGTTVSFRAIPTPNGASWPSGKPEWSGSSGASGTGGSKDVTFNVKSSSASDKKAVTASCGNSVTAEAIVYELTPILFPDDNFTGRALTKFGCGELVLLAFYTEPGLSSVQVGGLEWSKELPLSGGGVIVSAGDGTGTYTAPLIASEPGINVSLRIEIMSGPSKGNGQNNAITVVKPSGGNCVRKSGTGVYHAGPGTFSVGINTNFYLIPKDVSFSRLEFLEDACTAVTSGWFNISASSGGAFKNAAHSRWDSWFPISTGDISNGCSVLFGAAYDYHYAFDVRPIPPRPAYITGDFQWNLPWKYTGDGGLTESEICEMPGIFTVESNGDATAEKGGAVPGENNDADPAQGY